MRNIVEPDDRKGDHFRSTTLRLLHPQIRYNKHTSSAMTGYTHDPPFDSGFLKLGDIHTMHYEQYGQPKGKPGEPARDDCIP